MLIIVTAVHVNLDSFRLRVYVNRILRRLSEFLRYSLEPVKSCMLQFCPACINRVVALRSSGSFFLFFFKLKKNLISLICFALGEQKSDQDSLMKRVRFFSSREGSSAVKYICYSKFIDLGNSQNHWQFQQIYEVIVSLRDFMNSLNF